MSRAPSRSSARTADHIKASALIREPKIVERVMAGSCADGRRLFRGRNITPSAESTISVDPHAVAVVFKSGIKDHHDAARCDTQGSELHRKRIAAIAVTASMLAK